MPPQLVLSKGQLVDGDLAGAQYQVVRKLGEGQFAEVWEVRQCHPPGAESRFALKLEKVHERKSVRNEYKVLQKLSSQEQVVHVVDHGTAGRHFFYVMDLLGDTLFDARRQAGGRLDLPSLKAVGLSTLAAIEGLHVQGWIHRDIKPANYVINPPNASASRGKWVLIDFGLARRYVDEADGSHLSARPDASFRGSTAYASVHAHRNEDLSRRDDLWSWFYMMLELVEGCLLWRVERDDVRDHVVDKHWILTEKEKCWQHPDKLARNKLPEPLLAIHTHLCGLSFTDTPDYAHLRSCLQQLPDQHVQLQLQHLIPTPAAAAAQQQNGLPNHQQQWNSHSPLYDNQQQQQRVMQASPLNDRLSPADSLAAVAAAAAGIKRQRGSESDLGAKRQRSDSSTGLIKQSGGQQQQQQHQVEQQSRPARRGSSSSSPVDLDDSSRGASLRRTSQEAAAAADKPPERRSNEQPPPHANGIGDKLPVSQQPPRQRSEHPPRRNSTSSVPAAAAAAAGAAGVVKSGSSAAGRASEIAELLTRFDCEAPEASKAATQQAVAGLCALPPLEAVCAISMTLDKLVKQSDSACLPAVSQLLLDLAAFASNGASEAAKVAKQQQVAAGKAAVRPGS